MSEYHIAMIYPAEIYPPSEQALRGLYDTFRVFYLKLYYRFGKALTEAHRRLKNGVHDFVQKIYLLQIKKITGGKYLLRAWSENT